MLQHWAKQPHLAVWWQDPKDETVFQEKYLNKLQQKNVMPYIIHLDSKPIGYIQCYEADKLGGGWWQTAGTYGLDLYIGEFTAMDQGFGTAILKQFVDRLFEDQSVHRIITDPNPDNARAIRSYEKAGFVKADVVKTPDGEALLMFRDRRSGFPPPRE